MPSTLGKKRKKKRETECQILNLKKKMMQSLLAKEAGTYRPTYLPTYLPTYFEIFFITVLLGTYLANCTDLPGPPNASVCLCLGTYLANLTDLPSPKFQRLFVCASVSLSWYLVPTYLPTKIWQVWHRLSTSISKKNSGQVCSQITGW